MDVAIKLGINTQLRYENIIDDIATLRLKKIYQYGEDVYREDDDNILLLAPYFDVNRKYKRLKNIVMNLTKCKSIDGLELLIEQYKDLANYSIMGIQLLDIVLRNQIIQENN